MYDPKLTKPPQDFSKGIPKPPVTPKLADDQEIDLDTWDDMVADKFKVPKSLMKAVRGQDLRPTAVPPLSAMHLLITGATGFVGREILRQARAVGHSARVLARRPGSASARLLQAEFSPELRAGDVLD